MSVEIVGAPGFVDRFRADLIPGLHEIRICRDVEPASVVSTEAGEILAVQSRYVRIVGEGG